ncbi:DUF512 domain-containing protein [Geosporobacter ferrireducens]|uniref:DUF512 domain-containing protein n=1 Tax=Geosporobacter ferrireducens TaxID=1424294 RepID=UPI00139CBC8B|nr:DUF512 domain-containing protein [Geosporobacter ferrireducens]MTI53900.1 DUF512 domain-containing protein [Geosporobacter ferrireducens]
MEEVQGRNIICEVIEDSIAAKLSIKKGDKLLKINHQTIEDIIEYMFLLAEEELEIEIEKEDGSLKVYSIRKEYDEDLGIVFENPIIDEAKSCRNKCVFCFIDQLPKDMRKTLYFKDDDSRLSFLQGNFITLTNMSDNDIEKIIRYRISPINISIHTTDPDLRKKMLNNKTAGNIMKRLEKLSDAGIRMNGQIVLCPEINDGKNLDKTIEDLSRLYPAMVSVAVVPVGLTHFRENLYPLRCFNEKEAKETIHQIHRWQKKLLKEIGSRFIFLSDEFYVTAKQEIPTYEAYEDFPQLENGVGLMAKFYKEVQEHLPSIQNRDVKEKIVSVATGISASDFMKKLCAEIERYLQPIKIQVYPIHNDFFGNTITVSGLITGSDIIKALRHKHLGVKLILPSSMFKAGENILLDDKTTDELERILNVPVIIAEVSGLDFINKIINDERNMEV